MTTLECMNLFWFMFGFSILNVPEPMSNFSMSDNWAPLNPPMTYMD